MSRSKRIDQRLRHRDTSNNSLLRGKTLTSPPLRSVHSIQLEQGRAGLVPAPPKPRRCTSWIVHLEDSGGEEIRCRSVQERIHDSAHYEHRVRTSVGSCSAS